LVTNKAGDNKFEEIELTEVKEEKKNLEEVPETTYHQITHAKSQAMIQPILESKSSVDNLDKIIKENKNLQHYITDANIAAIYHDQVDDKHEDSNHDSKQSSKGVKRHISVFEYYPHDEIHYFPIDSVDEKYLHVHPDDFIANKLNKQKILNKNKRILTKRLQTSNVHFNDIDRYYNLIFNYIKENLNEKKKDDFEHEKVDILKEVFDLPPKFPTVRCILLDNKKVELIDSEWTSYEGLVKQTIKDFKLERIESKFDIYVILKYMYIPAIVGGILGLLVGLSSMRNILFSVNHYITNIVDGIYLITKSAIPIMYIPVGMGLVSAKALTMNVPITNKYVYLSMLMRFAIMPSIGYIYVWLWKEYYGGIIATSLVFRITLFIPFCVPSTANMVVMVNMIRYFIEESSYILFTHNVVLFMFLPILYMIYFIIVGTNEV
jgi:hypothetical protein